MSQDEAVQRWLEGADKALRAAKLLHEDGNDELALFDCHLCAEKILKALYIRDHDCVAPRTHDLAMLVSELEDLQLQKHFEDFKSMSKLAVAARYDDLEILEEELQPARIAHWLSFCTFLLEHAKNQKR